MAIESQPCPRCKKILEHHLIDQFSLDEIGTYLEKYEPYNTWSIKGKGDVTFTKHAFKCPVCEKRWLVID